MTPRDLVSGIMQAVVIENFAIYRDLFTKTSPQGASDPYWKRASAFFEALSDDQRSAYFEIVYQVTVDTTSNILGVLDGVNMIKGIEERIVVADFRGNRLNGDLQSLFLTEEEAKRP